MMDLADDFQDLLVALVDAGAEFVVLGGYAVAFHGMSNKPAKYTIYVGGGSSLCVRNQVVATLTAVLANESSVSVVLSPDPKVDPEAWIRSFVGRIHRRPLTDAQVAYICGVLRELAA